MINQKTIDDRYTFSTDEKLKSRKLIDELFKHSAVAKSYPIRIHYMTYEGGDQYPIKTGVSVSKRNFKRAVDRNRIKRMLREGYRLHNTQLKKVLQDNSGHFCMMIIYTDRKMPDSQLVHTKMVKCLDKITKAINAKSIES